jgi:hypothetical protein
MHARSVQPWSEYDLLHDLRSAVLNWSEKLSMWKRVKGVRVLTPCWTNPKDASYFFLHTAPRGFCWGVFIKWDVSEALVCHACLHRILVQEAHDSMLLGGYRHCIMYWLITSCSTSGLGFADGDCVVDLVSGLTMSGNKCCYSTQICVFLAAILDKCCHVYGHSWKL